MLKRENVRSDYLDIVKGFAIVLVVFGHCIQFGSGYDFFVSESYFDNVVFKAIYSFHMPLFMLVSGYLFYYSINKHSTKKIINSRFTTLLLPILSWSIIILLFKVVMNINTTELSISVLTKSLIRQFIYNLWFLWAIFFSSMAVIVVKKFCNDKILLYLLIEIILVILPDIFNTHLYKFMFPYFIVGYVWNRNQVWVKFKKHNIHKTIMVSGYIILTIFYTLLLTRFNYNSYIYTTGITVWQKDVLDQMGINLFRWLIGFVGCTLILLLLTELTKYFHDKMKLWTLLCFLGRKSVGIYIISGYILESLFIKIIKTPQLNYMITFFEMFIIVIVSLMITLGLERYWITRKIFLGGR